MLEGTPGWLEFARKARVTETIILMEGRRMTTKGDLINTKKMERLLNNPQKITIEFQREPVTTSNRCLTFRGTQQDFDSLNAEEMIRLFNIFLRNVISRFEENKRMQDEAEARENDLRHCMELVDGLTEKERRMIYRRLTDTLQTRRACKIENEILAPLYNEVSDKTLINKLARIQGQIGGVKEVAGNRAYSCRTSVLDDFRVETTEKVYSVG